MITKTLAIAGLAVVGLAGLATSAAAYPAVATGPVAVREGPGLRFDVEDRLRFGERVDVRRCTPSPTGLWCYVQKSGPDGWVASRYLSRGGWDDDWPPPAPWPTPRPPMWGGWGGSASACFNGPNGYFCFGNNG